VNPRYRATARRHRVLFALIILLCALLGLAQALGAPKLYRSDATLKFPSLDSSAQFGATPPATQAQGQLTELLLTRTFPQFVAAKSPLGAYLKHHSSTGGGPITMLKDLLKGSPTYDDRIATALGPKRVTSMPTGDNLLSVSFEAATPDLAQKTLAVLINRFLAERVGLQIVPLREAKKQLRSAQRLLMQTQHDLNSYVHSHPASTTNGDPEQKALSNAALQASTGVSAAAAEVATNSQNLGSGESIGAGILDHPNRPVGPTTGKKKVGELTIVGAFLGALISFGLIALMSRSPREEPPALSRPVALPEPSSNGGSGAEHEPDHEVVAGEPRGSNQEHDTG
jgi:hypothetical protein